MWHVDFNIIILLFVSQIPRKRYIIVHMGKIWDIYNQPTSKQHTLVRQYNVVPVNFYVY